MATEIKVHKPSEREAKECTGEDEPEDEVVSFAEPKGIVDFASPCIEAVLWGSSGCNHCAF